MKTRRYRKAEEEKPEAETLSELKREVRDMMRSIEIDLDREDDDEEDED